MANRPSRFPPRAFPRWTPSTIRLLEETVAFLYREADRTIPRSEWDTAAAFVEFVKANTAASPISPEGRERIAAAQRRRWARRRGDAPAA